MISANSQSGQSADKSLERSIAVRELMAVKEIVHAFLTADKPEEVFQFALERVSPLVEASFASIYLVDGASELMRLAASYNWPERYRPFLGEMRVRLGFGPSGEAASERRIIHVPDVFADPALEDWQEVASELGFRALVALPLQTRRRTLGAVTFYFAEPGGLSSEQRGLLRIVADQMAATAEKSVLISELRRANAALVESNAELERQYLAVVEARRVKDEFLANVSHELRTPLTAVMGYVALLQEGLAGPLTGEQQGELAEVERSSERLLLLIDRLLELTSLKRDGADITVEPFDPRSVLQSVAAAYPPPGSAVQFRTQEPPDMVPDARTDRTKLQRILALLLDNAFKFTSRGQVTLILRVHGGRLSYTVRDTGVGIREADQEAIFQEFRQLDSTETRSYGGSGLGLALARRLARLLRGDVTVQSAEGEGSEFTVDLPLEYLLARGQTAQP